MFPHLRVFLEYLRHLLMFLWVFLLLYVFLVEYLAA